jgi:hypothetical protein
MAPAPAATAPAPEPPAAPQATAQAQPAPTEDAGAPATVTPSGPDFTLDLLKRQGHRIVRAMSREEPIVPVEADTPWARFRRHLEAAHVERGASVQQDSYTSPDGTVIYRKRVGNRTMCRTGGSIGGGTAAGVRSGGDAGWIPCPSGVAWKREP